MYYWNIFHKFKGSFKRAEAFVWRCSVKKVFLEILPNLQENTCELGEISKRSFFLQNISGGCFWTWSIIMIFEAVFKLLSDGNSDQHIMLKLCNFFSIFNFMTYLIMCRLFNKCCPSFWPKTSYVYLSCVINFVKCFFLENSIINGKFLGEKKPVGDSF